MAINITLFASDAASAHQHQHQWPFFDRGRSGRTIKKVGRALSRTGKIFSGRKVGFWSPLARKKPEIHYFATPEAEAPRRGSPAIRPLSIILVLPPDLNSPEGFALNNYYRSSLVFINMILTQ